MAENMRPGKDAYKNRKILIIDDQPINHEILSDILTSNGYENILSLYDPHKASDLIPTYDPDIIILDMDMPDISGEKIIYNINNSICSEKPLVVAVFNSAIPDEKNRKLLNRLDNSIDDFLKKPFINEDVITRIKNIAKISFLQEELKESTKDDVVKPDLVYRYEKDILKAALYDRRTGFPNSLLLQHRFSQIIEIDECPSVYTLIIYLKHFDEINNVLGYQNGDKLLMQAAVRLNDMGEKLDFSINIEENKSLALLQGVSFAMLINAEKLNIPIRKVAEQILNEMQRPFEFQGMSLDIGALVGISSYPEHGDCYDTLIQHAQIAMEMAFNSLDHYAEYAPDIDPYSSRRLSLMTELRNALENDELELFYQPQIDTLSGGVLGLEALIRWKHPSHGYIPPDEFIPLAEQTGVIKPLSRWVLNRALSKCAEFLERGSPLRMSVNISPLNLQEKGLDDYIINLLASYSLPHDLLVLELTETAMMIEKSAASEILKSLDEKGVKISVDDFGTGYSSLTYLKQLPLDELKIDKSFVMDMLEDKDDLMIVHATIEMGHNLGLEIVAEGVETEETFWQLRDMGCNTVQGYFFSKPLNSHDLDEKFISGELNVNEY
ncbi:MAG: EAL domain-containing protein [Gammaproteobacteria bacterium]|nr:MAG: EAL domain-containing protein [Gammaproteobacteria bacterium]